MRSAVFSLALLVMSATGCGLSPQQDAHLELLGAEKRWLEDELLHEKRQNEALQRQLASCHHENETLRQELGGGGPTPADRTTPRRDAAPRRDSPVTPPEPVEGDIDIDLGLPSTPLKIPQSQSREPPEGEQMSYEAPADEPAPSDWRVTQIVINKRLTGGIDLDGAPGHEAVSIVIEPRNAAGEYVPLAGPLTVSVLDLELEGFDGRIGHWGFSAHEARSLLMRSETGCGLHLMLPWANRLPERPKLQIQAQYTTVDGRSLRADLDITIDPPPKPSSRWTPSAGSAPEAEAPAEAQSPPRPRPTWRPERP